MQIDFLVVYIKLCRYFAALGLNGLMEVRRRKMISPFIGTEKEN